MKKTTAILTILAFLVLPIDPKIETTEASPFTYSEIASESPRTELVAGLFGWGKPKYNKRKLDRQSSPKRMNRRAKSIQRRYNLAAAPSINWTLIDVQLARPLLAYELRKGVFNG